MNVRIRRAAAYLAAPAAGICISIAIAAFFSPNPLDAALQFAAGPFLSSYYTGIMLSTASLLMWGGLGAACALITGSINLGGEGQIYAAGLAAAVVFEHTARLPAPISAVAAITAAVTAGAAAAGICALLKNIKGASELLSSFLLSAFLIPIIDAAVSGPLRDPRQNLLATPAIAEKFRIPQLLPPSPFNISFFAAAAACICGAAFLYKTKTGRNSLICGTAPQFARYAGLPVVRTNIAGMALSGAFHGLTGFFAVCGVYYSCPAGFYSGMGWNALTAALIARAKPLAVLPASLLMGWLLTAADRATLTQGLAFDLTGMIQAAVLFCVSARIIRSSRREAP